MPQPDTQTPIWVIVEKNLVGTRKPLLAIADALQAPYRLIEVDLPQPWRMLTPHIITGLPTGLSAPWPKLVISGGRQAAGVSLWIKRMTKGTSKHVHLLSPHGYARDFDLVIRPQHDGIIGDNIFTTIGTPSHIDAEQIEQSAMPFRPLFAPLPTPRLSVFLGGPRKKPGWRDSDIIQLQRRLLKFIKTTGGSVIISPSRRTPPDALQKLLSTLPSDKTWAWDGSGDNPYAAMFYYADAVAVTADSTSTVCEVATYGKPLYIIDLGPLPDKLVRFNAALEHSGVSRLFLGSVDKWHYDPLNEAARVANEIKSRKLWV